VTDCDVGILLVPHGIGRFVATLNGMTIIKPTRQPFFNAARALLQLGYDPTLRLCARHQGATIIAMSSTIGEAAKWAIEERDRSGLRKVLWTAYPSYGGASKTGDVD
jgi:hypothetical protein